MKQIELHTLELVQNRKEPLKRLKEHHGKNI